MAHALRRLGAAKLTMIRPATLLIVALCGLVPCIALPGDHSNRFGKRLVPGQDALHGSLPQKLSSPPRRPLAPLRGAIGGVIGAAAGAVRNVPRIQSLFAPVATVRAPRVQHRGTAQKQRKLDSPLPPLLPSPSLSFCSSRLPARSPPKPHPPPFPASGTALRPSTHPPPRGAGRHLRHAGRLRGGAGTSPRRFMRSPAASYAPSAPRVLHRRHVPNDCAPTPGGQATGLNPFVALCRAGDFWRRAVPLLIRYRLEEQAAPSATPLSIVRRRNGLHADSTGCAARRSTTASFRTRKRSRRVPPLEPRAVPPAPTRPSRRSASALRGLLPKPPTGLVTGVLA
jgi:hypothetical protein